MTENTRRAMFFGVLAAAGCATAAEERARGLVGVWEVSLVSALEPPPGITELVISGFAGRDMTGAFFGSPFADAGYQDDAGVLVFMAMTRDASGASFHSWRIDETGALEGETFISGRQILMKWRAERKL
jgi:hypothetical protein